MTEFAIKDSGARQEFGGGMVRDTTEGKIDWLNLRFGPLFRRVAEHLTKGRTKYPDPQPGVPNWTLAEGREEALRAKSSAARHFEQWLQGDLDEDHASAVVFNMNLFEYCREKDPTIPAGFGTGGALPEPVIFDGVLDFDDVFLDFEEEPYAGKPWHIEPQDSITEAIPDTVFGFGNTQDLRDFETQPSFGKGDLVEDAFGGDGAQKGIGIVTDVRPGLVFDTEVEWPSGRRSVHQRTELALVESACNSNCLGCDC